MCLMTPGSANGSTSVCPWLWSGEMLPAYWPVCEFDLTLRVLFLLSSSCFQRTDHHHCLPLAPVSMCSYCLPNPRSLCKIQLPSVVQCYLVHWLNILSITRPMMRVTAWFRVQHCLKPLRHSEKKNRKRTAESLRTHLREFIFSSARKMCHFFVCA